jgi:hypothetical protein
MRVPNHICELSKPSNPVNLKLNQSFIHKKNRFTAHKHDIQPPNEGTIRYTEQVCNFGCPDIYADIYGASM